MAYAFITVEQLTNRMSPALLRRLTDDNRVGAADSEVVAQIIADATSKVAGYCQGIHTLSVIAEKAGDDTAHEVVRLTLDVANYMAILRHPEVARAHDPIELMKAVNSDLKMLRESFTTLDTDGSPNPPANVGGVVYPDPDTESVYSFARDGFGDF